MVAQVLMQQPISLGVTAGVAVVAELLLQARGVSVVFRVGVVAVVLRLWGRLILARGVLAVLAMFALLRSTKFEVAHAHFI
jgi:hypothetical protein